MAAAARLWRSSERTPCWSRTRARSAASAIALFRGRSWPRIRHSQTVGEAARPDEHLERRGRIGLVEADQHRASPQLRHGMRARMPEGGSDALWRVALSASAAGRVGRLALGDDAELLVDRAHLPQHARGPRACSRGSLVALPPGSARRPRRPQPGEPLDRPDTHHEEPAEPPHLPRPSRAFLSSAPEGASCAGPQSAVRSYRGGRTRTAGLLLPKQALYQAELRPVRGGV